MTNLIVDWSPISVSRESREVLELSIGRRLGLYEQASPITERYRVLIKFNGDRTADGVPDSY